ncbi:MAG: alpha/beta fold hydrolase [Rhodospirillales bacterium]|nr:alpha/beta fold hydrolase [Rhodospirillales bacterium]
MDTVQHVVFLPGLLDDRAMWAHQVNGLSNSANPVMLDLVDHGSVSESAEWVLQNSPETFALVGFSMGGYVAFEILRQASHRVSKLALVSTSARADTADRIAEREQLIARAEAGDYASMVDELIPRVLHPSRADDHALIGTIREMALRIGYEAFVRQLRVIMSRPDSRMDLAGISCPTIVVVGREDVLTPPELSEEMAAGIEDSELVLINDCNHYTPMERPELVTNALHRWLVNV